MTSHCEPRIAGLTGQLPRGLWYNNAERFFSKMEVMEMMEILTSTKRAKFTAQLYALQ
jgi:hypothetical protein